MVSRAWGLVKMNNKNKIQETRYLVENSIHELPKLTKEHLDDIVKKTPRLALLLVGDQLDDEQFDMVIKSDAFYAITHYPKRLSEEQLYRIISYVHFPDDY